MPPTAAFVISMETPTGRARLSRFQQRMRPFPGVQMEVMHGVDGKEARSSGNVNAACRMTCTPGMIGIALSHVQCWQHVVDRDLEHAIIFEDDAVVVEDFEEKMRIALDNVPTSYHVLLLGCFSCAPFIQKLFSGGDNTEHNGIRTISYFNGTHAYIVSQEGARFLLHATQKKASYHIDFHMSMIPGFKIYAVSDDLALQEDMETSSIAAAGPGASFPGTINSVLSTIKTSKNVSWSYCVNVPYMQLGPIPVTLWTIIFFGLGLLSRKIPWTWFLLFALMDILIVPPKTLSDVAVKSAIFALGRSIIIKTT